MSTAAASDQSFLQSLLQDAPGGGGRRLLQLLAAVAPDRVIVQGTALATAEHAKRLVFCVLLKHARRLAVARRFVDRLTAADAAYGNGNGNGSGRGNKDAPVNTNTNTNASAGAGADEMHVPDGILRVWKKAADIKVDVRKVSVLLFLLIHIFCEKVICFAHTQPLTYLHVPSRARFYNNR
jgi:hypothetical protein